MNEEVIGVINVLINILVYRWAPCLSYQLDRHCAVCFRSWSTSKWLSVSGWWTVRISLITWDDPDRLDWLWLLHHCFFKRISYFQMCWRRWILWLQMIEWCSGPVRGRRTESSSRWWDRETSGPDHREMKSVVLKPGCQLALFLHILFTRLE